MKTSKQFISLLTILFFFTSISMAQIIEDRPREDETTGCDDWWEGPCGSTSSINRLGNVHIGSTQDADEWSKLQLNGNLGIKGKIRGLNSSNHFIIQASNPTDHWSVGSYLHLYGEESNQPGRISITTRGDEGDIVFGHNIAATNSWFTNVTIKPNGKVIIGGTNTDEPADGFKLAVAGGIQTQKVKVCASASSWCDYVFEKEYERNSIQKVKTFIQENKHLPNVPSAQEVEDEGINVAEMDATLLRQIEELWLHVIDLKEENEELKKLIINSNK